MYFLTLTPLSKNSNNRFILWAPSFFDLIHLFNFDIMTTSLKSSLLKNLILTSNFQSIILSSLIRIATTPYPWAKTLFHLTTSTFPFGSLSVNFQTSVLSLANPFPSILDFLWEQSFEEVANLTVTYFLRSMLQNPIFSIRILLSQSSSIWPSSCKTLQYE
jgi:hypothetical protein